MTVQHKFAHILLKVFFIYAAGSNFSRKSSMSATDADEVLTLCLHLYTAVSFPMCPSFVRSVEISQYLICDISR